MGVKIVWLCWIFEKDLGDFDEIYCIFSFFDPVNLFYWFSYKSCPGQFIIFHFFEIMHDL